MVLAHDEDILLGNAAVFLQGPDLHLILPLASDSEAFSEDAEEQVAIPVLETAADDVGRSLRHTQQILERHGAGGNLVDAAHQGAHPQGSVFPEQDVVDIVGIQGAVQASLGDMVEMTAARIVVNASGGSHKHLPRPVCRQAGHMVIGQGKGIIFVMPEGFQGFSLGVIAEQSVFRSDPQVTTVRQDSGDVLDVFQSRPQGKIKRDSLGGGRFPETLDSGEAAGPDQVALNGEIPKRCGSGRDGCHLRYVAAAVQ